MATTTERGLTLPCPCCGEGNATILLNLADAHSLTCQECNTEFTLDDVRDLLKRWAPVLAWVEAMPMAHE